jgi:hypothetical protein
MPNVIWKWNFWEVIKLAGRTLKKKKKGGLMTLKGKRPEHLSTM